MSADHAGIREALQSLCLSHAFFASIALQHAWEEDNASPTFSTDGKVMRWNRAFADGLTFDAMKGLIAHEAMHVALMHHTRRGDREPKRWNRACDYAINLSLTDAGFTLPDGGLLDERFRNMDAESIFRTLAEEQDKEPQDANGNPVDAPGEVRDAPGDKDQAEQEAKVMTAQAQRMAERAGQMPGSLARELEAARESRTPWREVLARFVEETARNDYSLQRPNKRFLHSGLILPGAYSREVGDVYLAIDTSGSISTVEVAAMVSELLGVLAMQCEQGTQPRLHVIYCDARVHGMQTLENESDVAKPLGGGGTDFAPVFAYLLEHDIAPRCLVYMTDGECSSFGVEPACPVLWGLIRDNRAFKPPFGEVFKAY